MTSNIEINHVVLNLLQVVTIATQTCDIPRDSLISSVIFGHCIVALGNATGSTFARKVLDCRG